MTMSANAEKFQNLFNVAVRSGDDGFFVAECIEIPGCMSQGRTEAEAISNVADAIKACLGVMLEDFANKSRRHLPNLVGIEKQETFRLAPPELEPLGA
jgi:predicted RNase H-like HicB family nuclease